MEAVAASLEALALAEWLRYSRWSYATLSAAHILGIALLLGGVLPLSLRLLGLWATVDIGPLYRVLSRVAATGLFIAVSSGFVLFATRATEYAALDLFAAKLALIGVGIVLASVHHFGTDPARISRSRQRIAGAVSLLLWPTVLLCGRFLAFV